MLDCQTEEYREYCQLRAATRAQEREGLELAIEDAAEALRTAQEALAEWLAEHHEEVGK